MKFKIGQTVLVTPRKDDIFSHEFAGTIVDIVGGKPIVEDKDSDFFTVEESQIEIIEPE